MQNDLVNPLIRNGVNVDALVEIQTSHSHDAQIDRMYSDTDSETSCFRGCGNDDGEILAPTYAPELGRWKLECRDEDDCLDRLAASAVTQVAA